MSDAPQCTRARSARSTFELEAVRTTTLDLLTSSQGLDRYDRSYRESKWSCSREVALGRVFIDDRVDASDGGRWRCAIATEVATDRVR